MKQRFFNIALTGLFFFSFSAYAAEPETAPPLQFKGVYSLEFDHIPLGKLGIEASQTPLKYAITTDVTTTGLLKVFVKHSSHTSVTANGTHDFTYPDQLYESHYQTKGKKKYVKMVTKNGKLVEDTLIPPDNPATRPPVAPETSNGAADPLSITLRMREELWKALQNHTTDFAIPLYDGRRLTQVNFTVEGKQTIRLSGNKVPVIAVIVSRKQLAGFSQQEINDFDPKEGHAHFFFSDDERLIPLRVEAAVWLGTASATLVKECSAGESCLLGITE